jgi:hypothetical protein
MKQPSAEELLAASKTVYIHSRTVARVDSLAHLVRTDPSIRSLIGALLRSVPPDTPDGAVIEGSFLTGLELGLRVGRNRWRNGEKW